MYRLLILLIASMTGGVVGAASDSGERFPGIEALMTDQQLSETGVKNLSAQELDALNRWLIQYTARDAPVLKSRNTEVRKVVNEGVKSRISGEFTGWTGDTVFRLENGQVWQQRYGKKWKTRLNNPQVVITRNFLGSFEMKVIDADRSIGVRRIN